MGFVSWDGPLVLVGFFETVRWEDDEKKPAKINHGDYSPSRPLGVEINVMERLTVSSIKQDLVFKDSL